MLIRNAEIYGRDRCLDVRLAGDTIAAVGLLRPNPGEPVLEAAGGALLPGLHDHHVHLMSYAASLGSVACGPPAVTDAAALIAALHRPDIRDDRSWIRGIGYHERVAGDIDRAWLDRHGPDCPVRIQHRTGRLWIVNSAGLSELTAADPAVRFAEDGRLYDQDVHVRALIGASLPPIAAASRQLARYGVTGMTDMTPRNDDDTLALFRSLHADTSLLQRVRLAGAPGLTASASGEVTTGETKIHLHEADLPPFDAVVRTIRHSHAQGRAIAVHCVTEVELVFTLAAIREAGQFDGDRIEHASMTPPGLIEQIRELGLIVVLQPNFVVERGDDYIADIPANEQPWLYRCRSFLEAGVRIAGGTDSPFGHADPWEAMQAAVSRTTRQGEVLGPDENLSPEQALALFLGRPASPERARRLEEGASADLCLLDAPWKVVREQLSSSHVRATVIAGRLVTDASVEAIS